MKKIFNLKEIKQLNKITLGKTTVLAGGCFDLIHLGHLRFLQKAKKEGDFLIIALESDKFIRLKKKREPVHRQKDRAEILAELKYVDAVILLPFFRGNKKYFDLVRLIKPKVIAVTENDSKMKEKEKQAKIIGGKLKIVTNLLDHYSTSNILKILNIHY